MGEVNETVRNISDTKRIESFSYIRAVACIAIVILHTAYASIIMYGDTVTNRRLILSRLAEYGMMWAVPCFIMVTGSLLLDANKKLGLKKLFTKYILRVFCALVLFCIIIRMVDMSLQQETLSIIVLIDGLGAMFTGSSWAYLWYLYALIGLYLLLPFYKKIVQYSIQEELKYLLGIYILFLSVLPILKIWDINCGFYIHTSTIYPMYLFLGYMIHNDIIRIRKKGYICIAVAATILVGTITVIRWGYEVQAVESLLGYSSVFIIAQAAGIFGFIDKTEWNSAGIIKKILIKIDECSFGIYLIHMIFVKIILSYVGYNPYKTIGGLGICIMVPGILLISGLVTWILKRIPIINKIV